MALLDSLKRNTENKQRKNEFIKNMHKNKLSYFHIQQKRISEYFHWY